METLIDHETGHACSSWAGEKQEPENLQKSTFSDIQPHFYRHTSQRARSELPFPLLFPQTPSPLSSPRVSSAFFILFEFYWGCLLLPTQKEVNSSKVQSWGRSHSAFTFCLTPYPISCSLNLWTLNTVHLTPTHTWWLKADSFTKMFPFPPPV